MLKKSFKGLILVVFVLLVVSFTIVLGVSIVLFNFFLNRESFIQMGNVTDRSQVAASIEGITDEREEEENPDVNKLTNDEIYNAKLCYASGKDIYIRSEDGLKLHARLITHDRVPKKIVVVCHGYMRRASHMSVYAYNFYQMGYDVLVPDARAHGESEGTIVGMGWLDRRDVCNWISYLVDLSPNCEIALHGVSMGGATVMMVSGEPLPSNVKAIVEDCGYTSVWDEFSVKSKDMMNLPEFPFLYLSSMITKSQGGYDFKSASSVDQVKKSVTPILFIHGDADTFVPFEMVWTIYNAATCEKEMLIVPGAMHGESFSTCPELYWGGISDFLNKYFQN